MTFARARRLLLSIAGGAALFAAGCSSPAPTSADGGEDARLQALIAAAAAERYELDPTEATKATARGDRGDWTGASDAAREAISRHAQRWLETLSADIDAGRLSSKGRLEREIFASSLKHVRLRAAAMLDGSFLYGNVLEPAVELPEILTGSHAVATASDAQNYLARLAALPAIMDETLEAIEARHAAGVTLTKTAYRQIANRAAGFAAGAPCGGEGENPLAAALTRKLSTSGVAPTERQAFAAQAARILAEEVCPAYRRYAGRVLAYADIGRDEGAWSLPDGERFYADVIELSLGERVSAKTIHAAGLAETMLMREALEQRMARTGFDGDLDAFNAFLRTPEAPSLPNTDEGRAAYVALAEARIAAIYRRMPSYFRIVPDTPLVVEVPLTGPMGLPPSAGAYYTEAASDGSRPAIYHLGVGVQPHILTWSLASVTYHEVAPGHHHQVETFRAAGLSNTYPRPFYPGYFDGWALYAEDLAGEMGGYDDDVYAEIGWLQAQLTRAIRMVLDTGLNAEGWSAEEAAEFQRRYGATIEGTNRYLAWPAQGLSYYWGYLEFKRLRREAEAALGERFDLRAFHHRVLETGPAPLPVVDLAVRLWIDETLSAAPSPSG